MGISALEAMFCGIPCLLTNVVGLRDFKELNSKDIYYSELEQGNFTENLELLYEKFQSNKLKNSKTLSELAHEKYNRQNSVNKYLQIYTQF